MTVKKSLTLLAFFMPLGLYLFTTAPGIFWEDSAAFQAAAYELGIVHNPSFPAYVLFAHIFTIFPGGSPQWWVNVSSALLGALSCLLVFLIALKSISTENDKSTLVSQLIALACAVAFAAIYGVWIQSVRAEVYAFTAMLILFLTWLALRFDKNEISVTRFSIFAGITFGLGLTSHYLIFMSVSAPLLCGLIFFHRKALLHLQSMGVFALFAILGLALYFYLPLRESADPFFNWGDFSTIGAALSSILRLDETLPIDQLTVTTPFFARVGSSLAELWRSLPLLLWVFAAIGTIATVRAKARASWLFLLMILSSVFVTAYAADFSPYNLDLYGYLIPAYAGLMIVAAIGGYRVVHLIVDNAQPDQKFLRYVIPTVIVLTLFVKAGYLVATNYTDASKRDRCEADSYASFILDDLQPGAIFLAGEDNSFSPLLCKQAVDGYRTDVAVLATGALLRTDYRRKMQLRHSHLWYPENWTERSFAEDFQNNLSEWIVNNSRSHQVAMTLSQWTSQLVPKLSPLGFCYAFHDSDTVNQSEAAASVTFYRTNQQLWKDSPDITTREHFGRLLYNLSYFYSQHHQAVLAAKYNRDAAETDPANVELLLNCLKMAILTKQTDDQNYFAAAIDELDPGNQKLEQIIRAAIAASEEATDGK